MEIKPDSTSTVPTRSVRFRIIHLFYLTALISSALATFGAGGIVTGVVFAVAWGWVFVSESRPRTFVNALGILLVCGCLCGLLLPAVSPAREAARRMHCSNQLKQIALALHNYHAVYKSFPPAYIADSRGRPIHSWRVLILPFLEQQPLYESYSFDEPWDGPNNRKLLSQIPPIYCCPSQSDVEAESPSHTNYVAVVGENTAWPGKTATSVQDIVDGTANTLLVCEVANHHISWMEPTDVSYSEAVEMLTASDPDQHSGHVYQSFFYEWSHGRQVAIADGSVRFIPYGIDANDAKLLLARNDYELHDLDNLRGDATETRRLRIGNCIRLAVFVLIVLWPTPWVWINPHGTRDGIRSSDAIVGEAE